MDNIPVTIKSERVDETDSPAPPPSDSSENDNGLPDYENSMLARSLLSGKQFRGFFHPSPTKFLVPRKPLIYW